jgi:WD40 repeat protein
MLFATPSARATLIVVALAVLLNNSRPVTAQVARIDAGPALECLDFSPDSRFLATAGSGNEIKIWDIQSLGLSHSVFLPTEPSEDRKNQVKLMEREGRPEYLRKQCLHGDVRGLSYSPDGSVLAALMDGESALAALVDDERVCARAAVFLCDPARGTATRPITIAVDSYPEWQGVPGPGGVFFGFFDLPCCSIAFSCQGDHVIAAYGRAKMWDKDGNPVRSFEGLTGTLVSFAACASRDLIAAADVHGMIHVFDHAGKLLYRHESRRKWSAAIAFSGDGRYVAFCEDTRIGLIDLHARRRIRDLKPKGHSWSITSVAFSPDSKLVASSTVDSTVTLWDVANRRIVDTFPASPGRVTALAFSPDGKTVACSLWEGAVLLRPVNPAHRR